LISNAVYFKNKMASAGFILKPSDSAIVALMLFNAKLSQDFAGKLLQEGIYVIGFYYPVVAKGQARIRIQLSAAHTTEQLDKAVDAFIRIGKEFNILGKSREDIIAMYGE
jgi:glycine C-acetyltransferase